MKGQKCIYVGITSVQFISMHSYINIISDIQAHNVDTNKNDLIVKMLKHFHLIVVVSHKVTSVMCIKY